MKNIPIIRYEHIRDIKDSHSVGVNAFEQQVMYLRNKGYNFLSLDEYLTLKKSNEQNPPKSVLLIFEGGWRDFYENAYPILKHYWLKAGLFIATEWIDESSKSPKDSQLDINAQEIPHDEAMLEITKNPRAMFCTWEELKKMNDVISFGTMTHTYRLDNFVNKPFHEDLQLSIDLIIRHLGVITSHLLWPRGEYDQNLLRTAKKMGLQSFYTQEVGQNFCDGNLDTNKLLYANNEFFTFKKQLIICANSLSYKLFNIFL